MKRMRCQRSAGRDDQKHHMHFVCDKETLRAVAKQQIAESGIHALAHRLREAWKQASLRKEPSHSCLCHAG